MNVGQEWKAVEESAKITGKEAYKDYRETSNIRDPKKFDYFTDYRRITRKIWRRVAQDSIEYEGGVHARGMFYIVPQVIGNTPFVTNKKVKGWISSGFETGGDIYTILFVNIMKDFKHQVWTMDGLFKQNFTKRFSRLAKKLYPTYTFFLEIIQKNKLG